MQLAVAILGELAITNSTAKLFDLEMDSPEVSPIMVNPLSSFELPAANWALDQL